MLRGLDMVEGRCHDASETLPRLSGAKGRRNGDGGPGGVSLAGFKKQSPSGRLAQIFNNPGFVLSKYQRVGQLLGSVPLYAE